MKKNKRFILPIVLVLLFQFLLPMDAFAIDIANKSSFEYKVTKVESGSVPGNIQVELYCETDPGESITTLGATLVVNTKYVDVVNDDGTVVTDNFKTAASSTPVGDNFGITAYKVGAKKKYSFSSMNALSLVSYNQTSGNLYIFLCGMAAAGLKLPEKSLIASFYLNSKNEAGVPDGAIRLMQESERGTECASKAIYVNEISSKKEVGQESSPMTMDLDNSLIVEPEETTATTKAEETTAAAKTTAAPKTTAAGKTTEKQSVSATEQSETTAAPLTTKAVEQMSEKEVEKELSVRIEAKESLTPTEEQAESPAFKAYEKAIEKAKEVLKDDSATVEQKKEVLEQVREAEQALKAEDAELAAQLEQAEKQLMYAPQSKAMWFYIGGGIIVLVAAVIMVLKLNKKETQEHFR